MSERPCTCENVRIGEPYTLDQCRRCYLFHHSPKHHAAWGGNGSILPRISPCIHRGAETGELLECSSCPRGNRVKILGCGLHGRCTIGRKLDGIACCNGSEPCPDYSPANASPKAGLVRNLLYHIYPMTGNGLWQRNVAMLLERISLFNGRRVASVMYGPGLDPPGDVTRVLEPYGFETLVYANNSNLREVASHDALFTLLQTNDPEQVTLYAHAKGVTRAGQLHLQRWSELLYEIYLDRWYLIEEQLKRYPTAGAFKKLGAGWPAMESQSQWHYSGSWFWFRNKDLYVKDWRQIDHFWSGIEAYPSLHFSLGEAACIFYEFPVGEGQLHNPHYFWNKVIPAYEKWSADNPPNREGWEQGKPQQVFGKELRIDLGGGDKPKAGFLNVDRQGGKGIDYTADFDSPSLYLPFADDSVAEVYSSHVFEHIEDVRPLLREVVRVCRVGAVIEIRVPSWLSSMALCHGHKHTFSPEQITHWKIYPDYWWTGCKKRLDLQNTEHVPSGKLPSARGVFPGLTDQQLMEYVPDCCHEVRYTFTVVEKENENAI